MGFTASPLGGRQARYLCTCRPLRHRPCAPRQRPYRMQPTVAKMYVPLEGHSPERQAANSLRTFFTFIAVRIVLSQLEGIGRGDLGGYNAEQVKDLRDFLEGNPIKNGDEWLSGLMQQNQMLAVRIMEVRAAYCKEDEFEWDSLKRLVIQDTQAANVRIMRQHAGTVYGKAMSEEHPNVASIIDIEEGYDGIQPTDGDGS